jgi:hypothetical protein
MNGFQHLPTSNDFGGIAQMMLSRTKDEQAQGMDRNIPLNSKHLRLQFNPQEPEEGQGRHGKFYE